MSGPRTNAAFHAAPVSEFLAASDEEAYAPLTAPKGYTRALVQLSAWHSQLPVSRAALADLQAGLEAAAAPWVRLEFVIPRLGRRGDAVRELLESFREQYLIVLTRSIRLAGKLIRRQRRVTEWAGLVTSSSAKRLKPHLTNIWVNIDPVRSFLKPVKDASSSRYLADTATKLG